MEGQRNGIEELSQPLWTKHSGRIWNPEKADLKTRTNLQNQETQIYKGINNKSENRPQICHQRAITKVNNSTHTCHQEPTRGHTKGDESLSKKERQQLTIKMRQVAPTATLRTRHRRNHHDSNGGGKNSREKGEKR